MQTERIISVVGLGYVGLPVAVAGTDNQLVAGISARFVPSPGSTTLFLFQEPEEVLPR